MNKQPYFFLICVCQGLILEGYQNSWIELHYFTMQTYMQIAFIEKYNQDTFQNEVVLEEELVFTLWFSPENRPG